jgi:deoxycytidine triphosphate deaminase
MPGILTAQDIIAAIDLGNLIVRGSKDAVEACSYDLCIGTIFHRGQVIDDTHPDARSQIIIEPGEIISMFTREELTLPADICATVFPLNSQSSKGLLVLNPGHIDPGFRGPVSVKALNLRKAPLAISLGMEIFTIIFERLPQPTSKPYAKNTSRAKREMAYNANDVEVSPRSLSALISFGSDSPYPYCSPSDRTDCKSTVSERGTRA